MALDPEIFKAYDIRGLYRASMYMRPGAIWSMEYALDKK